MERYGHGRLVVKKQMNQKKVITKLLKLVLFITLFLITVTIAGCMEERRGTVDLAKINYSLYGPFEMDIANQ